MTAVSVAVEKLVLFPQRFIEIRYLAISIVTYNQNYIDLGLILLHNMIRGLPRWLPRFRIFCLFPVFMTIFDYFIRLWRCNRISRGYPTNRWYNFRDIIKDCINNFCRTDLCEIIIVEQFVDYLKENSRGFRGFRKEKVNLK